MTKRSGYIYICGIWPLPCFFLLLFVILISPIAAQSRAPSFDEIAAQAVAAQNVNDIPRAIELYKQGVQLNPQWMDGWWALGLLQYQSEAYPSAIDALSHILASNPNAGPALALRGLCEFETGDYPQSLTDLQHGIANGAATDPNNENILRYHEAMLLTRLGKFQDAVKAYSFFAEHKLSNPELLIAIGLAGLHIPLLPENASTDQQPLLTAVGDATFKFMQGDEQAAQSAFDDVFQRFPAAPNVHFLYGNLLYAIGPDAAAAQYKQELDVAPNSLNALTMVTWSLLMSNQAHEALPYAKKLAEEQPEQATAQLSLGRALLDTGDVSGGLEHLEHALKLEPDNLEVHIALAKAYSESGRDDDARRERTLCLQMSENSAARLAHP